MSGREIEQHALIAGQQDPAKLRAAAIHIADRVAAEHPHPLDQRMPRVAGAGLATDPLIAAGVLDLIDALGIRPDQIRRTP